MANRGPPPPPPGIGFPAPPGMVHGGPGPRPQQAPQPQQYPPPPPHQQAYPGGSPAYRPDTFINASTRIHDIRPEETESKEFCLEQLTSYEVYTILPNEEDDAIDSKDTKNKKNTKDPKASKKRERWAKAQINQESYPTDQIIKTIDKLNSGQSITEKKARLRPNQSSQVTNILDEKIMSERESHLFEWVLVQLDRVESTNPRTGNRGTASMTIYLKRAPLPTVDVVDFYRSRKERERAQRQAHIAQQQHALAMRQQQQQQQQQQQMGGGPAVGPHPNQPRPPRQQPPVTIVQDHLPGTPVGRKASAKGGKAAGVKIAGTKVKMCDSDSFGESDASLSVSESGSDTDFYNSDNDTPNTSNSSRDGRSRKSNSRHRRSRSRERSRNTRYAGRGEDFVFIDHPRPRKPTAYAPDVPRFDGRSPTPAGSRVHGYEQQPVEIIARTRPGPSDAGTGGFSSDAAEAYALGVMAGTRGTAAGSRVQSPPMMSPAMMSPVQVQYAVRPQRVVSNLERAADEDLRNREEQRMLEGEATIRRNMRRESEERVERVREIEDRLERLSEDVARRERVLEEKREREIEEKRERELLEERRVKELEERRVRELEERLMRNETRRDRGEIELRLEREIESRLEKEIESRLERERAIESRRERERDIESRRERERALDLRRERDREIELRRERDRDHYEPTERYRATPMRSRSPLSPRDLSPRRASTRDLSPRRASPRDRDEQYHPRRRMSTVVDYGAGRRMDRVAPLPPLPRDEEGEFGYVRNSRSPVNPFRPLGGERDRY